MNDGSNTFYSVNR